MTDNTEKGDDDNSFPGPGRTSVFLFSRHISSLVIQKHLHVLLHHQYRLQQGWTRRGELDRSQGSRVNDQAARRQETSRVSKYTCTNIFMLELSISGVVFFLIFRHIMVHQSACSTSAHASSESSLRSRNKLLSLPFPVRSPHHPAHLSGPHSIRLGKRVMGVCFRVDLLAETSSF